MSRVADLLEDWARDPAYTHDFAALARELQLRCATQIGVRAAVDPKKAVAEVRSEPARVQKRAQSA